MKLFNIGRRLAPLTQTIPGTPDWKQANPRWIDRSLTRALARPTGGWLVVDATREMRDEPRRYTIAGQDVVAWRSPDGVLVAPNACPHMGALLSDGCVRGGDVVCPWHGLALGRAGHGPWKPYPTHDDGVLTWIRMGGSDNVTEAPIIAPRPANFVDAVIRMEATCEPEDVIANRLDPWHGVHFHPHSFARLKVTERDEDVLKVRVAYRIAGPLAMEVDATFHSPEPNTITMTIVDGDGIGSVVETHATPVDLHRTAITEATLATSDRWQFRLAHLSKPLLRPLIQRAARRLWVEDAAYAERRFQLRSTT